MGLGKTIFIIVLIIFAIWYFSPGTFDLLKDKATNAIKINNSNSQLIKDKIGEITNTTDPIDVVNSSNKEAVVDPIIYPCDLPNYGLPDYEGTSKEGDDCMDVPLNQDYECLANPPTNYDGYINLVSKTSSPQIICCEIDGYCRWGDD